MSFLDSAAGPLISGEIGGIAALGVALLAGVVAGFGPCVLPIMPAVFGYVTGTAAQADDPRSSTLRAMALSFTFVLGMSIVFAALGVLAALLGRSILVGSWGAYVAAAICLALGLHMLGLITLPFDRINRILPARRPGRGGWLGALLFGMVFALVASPCSTPILAAIATIAAIDGSAIFGAALLFTFGLGKGTPLLLIGLLSGVLPRLGSFARTADVLTRIGGAVLIGAALYLVLTA